MEENETEIRHEERLERRRYVSREIEQFQKYRIVLLVYCVLHRLTLNRRLRLWI